MAHLIYDVAVVGAGPAGMMAALSAARSGAKVVLLEKNDKLGLKLLATGNGRCNITNRSIALTNYYGTATIIFEEIYSQFDNIALEKLFNDLGVEFVNDDRGRVFPSTDKSTTILTALLKALSEAGVTLRSGTTVKSIDRDECWQLTIDGGDTIEAKSVVLTTGGKASFRLGSSGDGLFWAMKQGHEPTGIYAALVPLVLVNSGMPDAMGVKMGVSVKAKVDDSLIAERSGDMLFTHFGVSGPAAMGLAGRIAPYLGKNKVTISIDLLPGVTKNALEIRVMALLDTNSKKQINNILAELLPPKLATALLKHLSIDGDKKGAEVSRSERLRLLNSIKNLTLEVEKTRPLKEAQVTSGGISANEITSNLASKIVPGLYFAGEIVDIDGDSGGYNLQWAWSSGFVAGINSVKGIS